MQIHEWRTEPWEGFGLTEKSDYNPSNSNPYFYRYSGEHAGLIANAADGMSAPRRRTTGRIRHRGAGTRACRAGTLPGAWARSPQAVLRIPDDGEEAPVLRREKALPCSGLRSRWYYFDRLKRSGIAP